MPNTSSAIVEISQAANKFSSSIVLQYENKYIDVKSILGLFTTLLNTASYELHVHGADAEAAIQAMSEVFNKHGLKFNIVK